MLDATSEEDSIRERVNKIYSEFDKEFSERRSKFRLEHPDLGDEFPFEDFENSVESKLSQLLERQGGILKEIVSGKTIAKTNENLLSSIAGDIRNIEHRIRDLKSLSGAEISSQQQGPIHAVSKDLQSLLETVTNLRSNLDRSLTQMIVQIGELREQRVRPNESASNVVCTGCVGFWGMFMFTSFQLIVFSCFIACLKMKEQRSKKYF